MVKVLIEPSVDTAGRNILTQKVDGGGTSLNTLLNVVRSFIDEVKSNKGVGDVKKKPMAKLYGYHFVSRQGRIKDYLNDVKEALDKSNACYFIIRFKTLKKFIAGWSPIYFITEVPVAWDPILDAPFIPGSTIKGIVRDSFEELIGANEATQANGATECVFGSPNGVGNLIFFDAYPIGTQSSGVSVLDYDIITPHYNGVRDEYSVKPTPIQFISINKGVTFQSFIAYRKEDLEGCVSGDDVTTLLLKSIILSMKLGWGRRTSRGYGELELTEVEAKCP